MTASALLLSPGAAVADLEFRVIDLGQAPNPPQPEFDPPEWHYVAAFGINDKGQVVGEIGTDNSTHRWGFVWLPFPEYGLQPGMHHLTADGLVPTDVLQQSCPCNFANVRDINIDGIIVGTNRMADPIHAQAWVLDDGEAVIHALLSQQSEAFAISDTDPAIIVGSVLESDVIVDRAPAFRLPWNATPDLLDPAAYPVMGHDYTIVDAFDVSNLGRAVGRSFAPTLGAACVSCSSETQDPECGIATFWAAAPSTSGQRLEGVDDIEGQGRGINDDHDVVGMIFHDDFCQTRAAYWEPSGANQYADAVELPELVTDDDTFANAIADPFADDELRVVGRSIPANAAVLWRRVNDVWEAIDLNDVVTCGDEFIQLREATDINNLGWIVGWGTRCVQIGEDENEDPIVADRTRAFLLIPADYCAGDIASAGSPSFPDGVVDVFDLIELINQWGPCEPDETCPTSTCCLADLSGPQGVPDGVVDVFDLIALVNNWGSCDGHPGPGSAPASFSDTLTEVGLTMNDWDDYIDILETGTQSQRENANCWMLNYLVQCVACPSCPDRDPFRD